MNYLSVRALILWIFLGARQSSQDHFLNLHRRLQGGHRVAVHACILLPGRFYESGHIVC